MSAPPVAGDHAGVRRFGMWVFLVTDGMSFAGLLLAYAVLRAGADAWPDTATRLDLPLAAVATCALVGSSLALLRGWLLPTLALGAAFLGAQGFEYAALARHGVGLGSDLGASIFFVATGWHGLHVVAGLVTLAAAKRAPAAALFWQFVDAVWLVLFTVFYLAPRVHTLLAAALGFAAAAAFAAVVFFAMNLRREARTVKVVFVLPFALPVAYTVALVADALGRGIRP